MAVISNLSKTTLSLKYKEGLDEKGKDILKFKRFSNVKVFAADQDIYDVSAALSPLMKYPFEEVVRTDDNVLINV
jgi:hypothetical protein